MTDTKCDIPGGFVDDWQAGYAACRAVGDTGQKSWFIPGDGEEPTCIFFPEGADARDFEEIIAEALRGSGWRAELDWGIRLDGGWYEIYPDKR